MGAVLSVLYAARNGLMDDEVYDFGRYTKQKNAIVLISEVFHA